MHRGSVEVLTHALIAFNMIASENEPAVHQALAVKLQVMPPRRF